MLMQNFGGTAKSIMVFLKKAYLLELLSANLFQSLRDYSTPINVPDARGFFALNGQGPRPC